MENNKNLSRESLEQMTTELLDELLHAELRREPTDGQAVRMILQNLKERDATRPLEISPEAKKAWDEYQVHTRGQKGRPARMGGWILKAVSAAVIVLVLLATIPQQVKADNFFGRLVSWTDSIFRLFDPSEDEAPAEYIYETDNPDLQQVYDTIVELGVTEPVVPRWLPEGYELAQCKVQDTSRKTKTTVAFEKGNSKILIKIDVYKTSAAAEYQKDDTNVETIEMDGTTHSILRNNEIWAAVWSKDNIECCIYAGGQKDVLIEILRSIYTTEDE